MRVTSINNYFSFRANFNNNFATQPANKTNEPTNNGDILVLSSKSALKQEVLEGCNNAANYSKKAAADIQKEIEKTYNELSALYKQGNKTYPDKTVQITENGNSSTMQEFNNDGKLFRESIFIGNKLYSYSENRQTSIDGSIKQDKYAVFENGKPAWYTQGHEKSADGSWRVEKNVDFENGKVSRYEENRESLSNGTQKVSKLIDYKNGIISSYKENYKSHSDGSKTRGLIINYSDGIPVLYTQNYEESADGVKKVFRKIKL